MPILSVDHIQIAMPEGQEDAARAFYIVILGFTEIPKPPSLINRGGVWLQSQDVQLHLGVEKEFHPARKAHSAFIVQDLDAMLEKVQRAGYEWDSSQPPLEDHKRAHVYDPFGNRMELMERT
jgi:catechol 2,3-dioxygenase-like lactoylglutathione lyase family enzyme